MTCEKAEGYLSAYLDDMLDPQLRQELEAHMESCAHCRDVLAEYRRFDEMLASVPRVAPPEALHDRIFSSPEIAALIRTQGHSTSIPLLERPAVSVNETTAEPVRLPARARSSAPPWKRVALQSAAVLALLLGSALLIKQGLLHFATPSGQGTPITIGGPQDKAPLSAGNRAVYERAGALWSVPGNGPELAKQLTPDGVTVAGWVASPNGQMIAYTDTAGRIHTIRSDDQSDTIVGRVSATSLPGGFWATSLGHTVARGLAWAPDGDSIAYVGVDSSGYATLHVMASTGAKDQMVTSAAAGDFTSLLWSADGSHLAYLETAGGSQHLFTYDTAAKQAHALASQADATDSAATFAQLAWVPGSSTPALTWAASDGTTITGIFEQPISSSGSATRLTSSGAQYTAADFTPHGSGSWVVSASDSSATLYTLSIGQSGVSASESTQSGPITHVVWSPDGSSAAYVTRAGLLGIWTPGAGTSLVVENGASVPVWSADGSRLAVQAGSSVLSVRVAGGQAHVTARLITSPDPVTLRWSPDGQSLTISGRQGVVIALANGNVKTADLQPADEPTVVWTVAG